MKFVIKTMAMMLGCISAFISNAESSSVFPLLENKEIMDILIKNLGEEEAIGHVMAADSGDSGTTYWIGQIIMLDARNKHRDCTLALQILMHAYDQGEQIAMTIASCYARGGAYLDAKDWYEMAMADECEDDALRDEFKITMIEDCIKLCNEKLMKDK